MNRAALRQLLIKRTGRWDLVSNRSTFADNGANDFIQAGLDYLDLCYVDRVTTRRYQVDLVNSPVVEAKYLMEPINVWAVNADNRILLSFLPAVDFRANYGRITGMDTGEPQTYSQVALKLAPSQAGLTSSNYTSTFTYDAEDLMFSDEGEGFEFDNLLILPPPNETYTIVVEGVFRSVLIADTDVCFWSVRFPMLCIIAARAFLETDQRNASGAEHYFKTVELIIEKFEATAHEWEARIELQKLH